MLKGIDVKERVEFVSASDPDKETATKFYIGNLTHADKIALFSGAVRSDKSMDLDKLQLRTVDIVKAGLKAVKNFDGKDYEPVPPDVIEAIPFAVIGELTSKIMELNFLKDAEVKN